ncbi:MAG: hypothetical protein JWL83_4265, partial [Actinomycetia bacterium]|nr:hypothetical protein [Actinomycetes bacterium]
RRGPQVPPLVQGSGQTPNLDARWLTSKRCVDGNPWVRDRSASFQSSSLRAWETVLPIRGSASSIASATGSRQEVSVCNNQSCRTGKGRVDELPGVVNAVGACAEVAVIIDLPVRALVRSAEAATRVFSALDRASVTAPPDPAALDPAWWSVRAACTVPPPPRVREAVVAAENALMVHTADGVHFDVLLVDDGMAVDLHNAQPTEVLGWTERHRPAMRPPRFISNRSSKRPELDSLDDPCARWIVATGWPLHQGFLASRLLKDFSSAVGLGKQGRDASMSQGTYGESRIAWNATRWCGGLTRSRDYALWDRDNQRAPLHRWPGDLSGRAAVEAELKRLVVQPVLDSTLLPGKRWWATLRAGPEAYAMDDSAILVHWHPERYMSVFNVSDPPSTWLLSRPGFAHLSAGTAYNGVPVRTLSGIDVPLASDEVVLSVACGSLPAHLFGEWHAVPERVPRGLLECARWVRQQVGPPTPSSK